MEGDQDQVRLLGDLRARLARLADLAGSGEKDEHVAVEARGDQAAHRRRDLRGDRPVVGGGEVLDRHLEATPFGAKDRSAEVLRERSGRERRAHRDDAQVRAARASQALDQGQRHVALQVPLVELVEHDRGDAVERRATRAGGGRGSPP